MIELIKKLACIHKWKRTTNVIWDTYIYECTKCGKTKQASRSEMEK